MIRELIYMVFLQLKRQIREAMEIHCQTPTMNRYNGYELKAIYGDVAILNHVTKHQTPSRDNKIIIYRFSQA